MVVFFSSYKTLNLLYKFVVEQSVVSSLPIPMIATTNDDELISRLRMCQISSNRVHIGPLIGTGFFGSVYKGTLSGQDGEEDVVGIKTLKCMYS